jgi:hypothetical protein
MKKKDLDAIIENASKSAKDPSSDEVRLLAELVIISAEQLLQLSEIKRLLSEDVSVRLDAMTKGFSEFDRRVSGKMAITSYDIDEDEDDTPR